MTYLVSETGTSGPVVKFTKNNKAVASVFPHSLMIIPHKQSVVLLSIVDIPPALIIIVIRLYFVIF